LIWNFFAADTAASTIRALNLSGTCGLPHFVGVEIDGVNAERHVFTRIRRDRVNAERIAICAPIIRDMLGEPECVRIAAIHHSLRDVDSSAGDNLLVSFRSVISLPAAVDAHFELEVRDELVNACLISIAHKTGASDCCGPRAPPSPVGKPEQLAHPASANSELLPVPRTICFNV